MTAFKAKVRAVYPAAYCFFCFGRWGIYADEGKRFGSGKTAFAAWFDAWRNIEAKNNQK